MPLQNDSLRLKRKVAAWNDDVLASLVAAYFRHLIPLPPSGAFLRAFSIKPLSRRIGRCEDRCLFDWEQWPTTQLSEF
jgi:hypothetical protein